MFVAELDVRDGIGYYKQMVIRWSGDKNTAWSLEGVGIWRICIDWGDSVKAYKYPVVFSYT